MVGIAGHSQVFLTEDADPVRRCCEVVHAPILEHHTFVQPEKMGAAFSLGRSRPIEDDNVQVVDLLDNPLGQLGEHRIDQPFECGQVALKCEIGVRGWCHRREVRCCSMPTGP